MSSSVKPLKLYFGSELAVRLANLIESHYPDFPACKFIAAITERVEPLELKGRVAVIADELREALPDRYPEAISILLNILGPENETEEGMFNNGYFLMPAAYFVEKYGLKHYEISMHAMYEITKRHTSEYAIRPYLNIYPDATIRQLRTWTCDPNPHVRRLVSEGTRPRLPWAKGIPVIKGDPAHNLALLGPLWNDPSFYVRKSVANHVNDLTKDHKQVALDWLHDRLNRVGPYNPWMARHSLRTLTKSGDSAALKLLELC
ncbi:hypothetical protein [Paenibacillus spongiae]|uniref:DNA alkylation repair protein n=1 Tax=Paenibacillus spongiae TaxID=2909671 RepID=A0ABY5SLF2_9BACL|nr:hypothetical protein [Paenibacillus spongiae]UVI33073.1 hypothetical protein L1F29_15070 [Paenibacillus spongiae]